MQTNMQTKNANKYAKICKTICKKYANKNANKYAKICIQPFWPSYLQTNGHQANKYANKYVKNM